MQKQKSDFATIFLLEFTKKLIENSRKNKIIKIKEKTMPQEIKQIAKLKAPKKTFQKLSINNIKQNQFFPNIKHLPNKFKQKLTIPKPKLPPRFQDIHPVPTEKKIDLGKLNPIIKDPIVQSIECDGPNIQIKIITKTGKKRDIKIILTEEEINKVIETFSQITKIPPIEGIYKVAAGNLIFLATISKVIGSKFVIRKIPQQQRQNIQMRKQRRFPNPKKIIRR